MGITELIKTVGDEHIQFQNLQRDLHQAEGRKLHGIISFNTDPKKIVDMMAGEESKYVGLVVWLPRNRLPKL